MARFSDLPFEPLPGTRSKPRAFFVDRWGTLLEEPVARPADVRFCEGAVDALFRCVQAGWIVYLLGNEEAVARGRQTEEAWRAVENHVLARLERHGVRVTRSYACLDHPREGVGRHRRDSVYLLPNTGAFYHAAHVDGVDLARSWVVGDSTVELVAGWRAGCRLAGVRTGAALADGAFDVEPELVGDGLAGVLRELLSLEGAILR